jgi:hypothetical protein
MIHLKLFTPILIMFALNVNSFAQTIIDPVDVPYFVIKRKTASVQLPESLGGKYTKGFAGVTIVIDSLGKLQSTEMEKLQLSGRLNLSYQLGQNIKNDTISKYETFLKKCVSKIKIVKTDKRKPPKISTITFLVRF